MQGASQLSLCSRGAGEGCWPALRLVQTVERVQGAHRQVGLISLDQHREFDLGCGDGENIDFLLRKSLEGLCRDAGMAAHADADNRDLGDVGRSVKPFEADCTLRLVE